MRIMLKFLTNMVLVFNTPHTHSGLTYSGVFFIKVPKEMKGGRFLFYRNFNEADFISTEYMGQFKKVISCRI